MRSPSFDRLRLCNVRCFDEVEIPLDPRVTVIIGENGAGKTTLAESLASLTAGDEGLASFPLRRGAGEGGIELFERGAQTPAAWWRVAKDEERVRLPEERYLFAYGRYRWVHFPPPRPSVGPQLFGPEWSDEALYERPEKTPVPFVTGRRATTLSAPDNHLLRDLGRYLLSLHARRAEDPRIDAAWKALDASVQALGEGLEGIHVLEGRDRDVPMIRRRGLDLELRELSDGYQAVLVIVLDLVFRYVFLSPPLDAPLERAATVVIDEVDLHLHPRWQRRVIRQLVKLFPKTQFVLTTHSPAVVQGAIDFGYEVLTLREKKGAVTAWPLSAKDRRALKGAQIDSVVVDRRLFGAASRYSQKYEAVEKKVRQLRKKVEAGSATAEERELLLEKLDRLEELVADEEKRQADGPMLSEIAKVQIASLKKLAELNRQAEEALRDKA